MHPLYLCGLDACHYLGTWLMCIHQVEAFLCNSMPTLLLQGTSLWRPWKTVTLTIISLMYSPCYCFESLCTLPVYTCLRTARHGACSRTSHYPTVILYYHA